MFASSFPPPPPAEFPRRISSMDDGCAQCTRRRSCCSRLCSTACVCRAIRRARIVHWRLRRHMEAAPRNALASATSSLRAVAHSLRDCVTGVSIRGTTAIHASTARVLLPFGRGRKQDVKLQQDQGQGGCATGAGFLGSAADGSSTWGENRGRGLHWVSGRPAKFADCMSCLWCDLVECIVFQGVCRCKYLKFQFFS